MVAWLTSSSIYTVPWCPEWKQDLGRRRVATEFFEQYLKPHNRSGRVRYLPGLMTQLEGVRRLTPNTYLDLTQARVARFFPREPRASASTADVVPVAAQVLARTMGLLSDSADIALSLTAGVDSRLSLAATRPIANDVIYYTYHVGSGEHAAADVAVAAKLCARLRLTHTVYNLNTKRDTPELRQFLERAQRSHAGLRGEGLSRLAFDLQNKWPTGRVHLKSSFAEIARTFYRRKAYWPQVTGLDPQSLCLLYAAAPPSPSVTDSFEEFCHITDFSQASLYNYDFADMFYWEHRIGTWHTLQVADFDSVHDTFVLHNNRRLLTQMLSVPLSDRLNNRLFAELMHALWPETLELPFNPRSEKPANLKQKVKRRLLTYKGRLKQLWE